MSNRTSCPPRSLDFYYSLFILQVVCMPPFSNIILDHSRFFIDFSDLYGVIGESCECLIVCNCDDLLDFEVCSASQLYSTLSAAYNNSQCLILRSTFIRTQCTSQNFQRHPKKSEQNYIEKEGEKFRPYTE